MHVIPVESKISAQRPCICNDVVDHRGCDYKHQHEHHNDEESRHQKLGALTSAAINTHVNVRHRPRSSVSEHIPNVVIGDALTACNVNVPCCECSIRDGGITLSSAVSTKQSVLLDVSCM